MHRTSAALLTILTASLAAPHTPWAASGEAAAQSAPTPAQGRALAGELGCGACHQGAPDPERVRARAPALGPGGDPLPADFVFQYLGDPQPRRANMGATRMPDFRLDEGERVALALLLGSGEETGGALAAARARHPSVDGAQGRRIFQVLGCAGCHAGLDGVARIQAPDLSREGARVLPQWLGQYLADPWALRGPAHPGAPGSRMPDFRLTGRETAALSAWLMDQGTPFLELGHAPLSPIQRQGTERFLQRRTSCLGCHRIQGRGGAIGPSLESVSRRLRPSFLVEMISDPQRAAPGSLMPHQPMPSREARRLARYLLDVGDAEAVPGQRLSLADPTDPAWSALNGAAGSEDPGAALYARHCAACHGVDGRGDGWNAASLPVPPTAHADAALMSVRVDDALYDGVHAGAWVLDGSSRMPAFGNLLTPDQIRSLVAHIRTLCQCQAPTWSRDAGTGSR